MALLGRLVDVSISDVISSNVTDTADTYSATTPYQAETEVAYGGRVYVSLVVSPTFAVAQSSNVDTVNRRIYKNGHGLESGDRVAFASSGTLPSPLSASTLYYVREYSLDWTGQGQWFDVSTSDGGARVNITSTGSGTLTVYKDPNFGVTPGTDDTKWLDSRPVNRYAMVDTNSLTKTTNSLPIVTQITPGARFNQIGFLALAGVSHAYIRAARDTGVAHTNELTRSEDLNHANWTKTNASSTSGTFKLVVTSASQPRAEQNSATNPTADAAVVWYVDALAGELSWLVLRTTGTGAHTLKKTWFNLSTGAVGTTASGHTASITALGGGIYRCTVVTAQGGSTGAFTCGIGIGDGDNDDSVSFTTGDGIYVFGAQFEIAAAASPYIPTTTAAVTTNVNDFYAKGYALTTTAFSDDEYAATYSETMYLDRLGMSDILPHASVTTYTKLFGTAATLECGSMLFGLTKDIGKAQYGASIGIENWTRVNFDEFGGLQIDATRGYSDDAEYEAMIPKAKAAPLRALLASVKDTPSLYFMAPNTDAPGGWDAIGIHHAIVSFRTVLTYPEDYLVRVTFKGVT